MIMLNNMFNLMEYHKTLILKLHVLLFNLNRID